MPAINWTPELEASVLSLIEAGSPLRATAEKNGISASAIIRQVQASEDFAKRYARAKEIQVEQLADELLTIADSADAETYNASRLQVDTRKWLLSKLIPKKYGDKSPGDSPDNPLHVGLQVITSVPRPKQGE